MTSMTTGRIAAVVGRDMTALASGRSYALMLLGGVSEPLMYLAAMGFGVGALVGRVTLSHGVVVSYAAFVSPALLAVSAMSGVLIETTYNFFTKLRHTRVFEAILATPVKPMEIAAGEVSWAMIRGSLNIAMFLCVMMTLGLAKPAAALAAFPAALLVGVTFAALGMAASTFLRDWQDFDLLATIQSALVLFSGTFFPTTYYPQILRFIVLFSPLYQGIELVREPLLGQPSTELTEHISYLCIATGVAFLLVAKRMHGLHYQ